VVNGFSSDWLLKYVVTVETTLIVSMMIFWLGVFPGIASQDWVKEYVVDSPPILRQAPNLVRDVEENRQAVNRLSQENARYWQDVNRRLLRIELALGIEQAKNSKSK
jgi:hypothetical protein